MYIQVINNKDKIKIMNTRLYSNQNIFHPMVANETQKKDNVIKIIRNIQKYVFENRISIGQFFEVKILKTIINLFVYKI